jgi:hypothetical protein
MWFFFSFHRKIMYDNKTTIETLEMKNKPYESKYNINMKHNIMQIMGTKLWLWPMPIMPASAKPIGEGIYFEKNAESEEDEDSEETPEEDNNNNAVNADNHTRQGRYQPENTGVNNTSNVTDNRPQYGQSVSNGGNRVDARVANTTDRMTVHNNETINKWDNLNNIVKSDNVNLAYKSSDEDNIALAPMQGNAKFANKVESSAYEEMKKQYLMRQQQPENQKEASGGKPLVQRTHQNQVESKSSSSHIMRKSRSPDGGQNVANLGRESNYVSPGQKQKGKPRKSTNKPKNAKRGTATSKNRIGLGYR